MKKVLAIFMMTVLISSCSLFDKEEVVDSWDNTNQVIDETVDGNQNDIDNLSDSNEWSSDLDTTDTALKDFGSSLEEEVLNDTARTEEEIVKEFEKELDSLFELLEWNE